MRVFKNVLTPPFKFLRSKRHLSRKYNDDSLLLGEIFGGNFDRKFYISKEAAKKFKWWIRNIFDAFAPIKLQPFDITVLMQIRMQVWKSREAQIK